MTEVRVLLTPTWGADTVDRLRVKVELRAPIRAGEKLFGINERTTVHAFCRMDGDFDLCDDAGAIPVETRVTDENYVVHRAYAAQRDTVGAIRIAYTLAPEAAGNNPVFDLGTEAGGMNGSGFCFMPAFAEGTYRYCLDWDLSGLPQGAVGAWAHGAGRVEKVGDEQTLMHSFYAAGMLDCVRVGNFGYYWFKNDAILENAMLTAQIFRYESAFFKDAGAQYTIFARHVGKPELRAGGTAAARSYMYLYRDNAQLDPTWLKFLFAHEMVHNWIHLDDTPFGTCTWYVEGMAEYYSALLPWRMGVVSKEELLGELNKRAKQYYENPAIAVSNAEAGAGLFSDRERTRVPYGRGFFYLTHADGMIRRATGGEKSLDDVMHALNDRFAGDKTLQNEAWIEAYGALVGEEVARRELENLAAGGEIVPDAGCYGGEIQLIETTGVQRGTDAPCKLWKFV